MMESENYHVDRGGKQMIKYDTCIRCGSKKLDKLKVNSRISLYYPEEKRRGIITQRVIEPTDALVCKECGHIEIFFDWEKAVEN